MNPEKTNWWETFFSGVALDLWRQAVTDEQTRDEADFIEQALALSRQAKLLDVPCGNGRLSLELAARGYQLTGIDLASDFVDEARSQAAERRLETVFEQRDMRDLPWQHEFDGVFCFGNSFGYLDEKGNESFLQAVARVLKPAGRFVIDTAMIAESILPEFERRRWFQVRDILLLIDNQYDHVLGRVDTEYTFVREGALEKRSGSHRVYAYRQLCRLLEEAGLVRLQGYSSLTQEPFNLGSQRLLLVAAKKT